MKPEKQQLIQDLLGDESRRDATLLAGGRILRRRRHWRAATRGLILAYGTPYSSANASVIWSSVQKIWASSCVNPLTLSKPCNTPDLS